MSPKRFAPPELVIFDCDGVLVDSEPISNRVLAQELSAIGLATTVESSMRDYMGRSWPACVEIFEARLGRALPPGFTEAFFERLEAALRAELRPVPGIHEALARIPTPICVASSGRRDKMQVTLGLTGLLPRFEGRIFSAADVARAKPWPDLFLHAAASLRAPAEACAVVEDSPRGVAAGIAAGMRVLGFAARTDPRELEAAGAEVFCDMLELPARLGLPSLSLPSDVV
jgi:HAD superfamily hydrolase (TIGR01509 family)